MKKKSNKVYRVVDQVTVPRVDGKRNVTKEVAYRELFVGPLDALIRQYPPHSDPPPRQYKESAGLPSSTLTRVVQVWDESSGWRDCERDPRRQPTHTHH